MTPLRLTRRQSREVDRIAIEEYGIPSMVLMENAASAIVDRSSALRASITRHDSMVAILCGKGNNGGDALAVARHLHSDSRERCTVLVLLADPPDQFTGDAAAQLEIITKMGLPIEAASAFLSAHEPFSGVVYDGVYGTGFRLPSRIDFRPLNARLAAGGGVAISIDLPSGMDADSGDVLGDNAVEADMTVTMCTQKRGFANPNASRFLGDIAVANLRVPPEVIERAAASSA